MSWSAWSEWSAKETCQMMPNNSCCVLVLPASFASSDSGAARGRAVVGGRAWVAAACYVADFLFFGGKLYSSAFLFSGHKLSSSVLTDFK